MTDDTITPDVASTSYEVRAALEELLERDLLGPRDGGREELPSGVLPVGRLVPRTRPSEPPRTRRFPTGGGKTEAYLGLTAFEVDFGFVAGVVRHTLLTSAARGSGDPVAAMGAFGPLIDHWHGLRAWTQLWAALRALIETLSRLGRHGDVAVLLGALRASRRAPRTFGADAARERAVEGAARDALGAAFEALRADGALLGDAGAVALARRLTRSVLAADGTGPHIGHPDLPASG